MLLRVQDRDDALIVSFGEAKILDEATILQAGTELLEVFSRATPEKPMVLNLEKVQFMSSAMIGKLVLISKKAKAGKIDLRMCRIQKNVLEVLKITRLNKVFRIDDDCDLDGPSE